MFRAARTSPIAYRDPWIQSFEDRIAALSSRPRRIAYFYERPDTSTFRYRVFNMVEALAAAPELGISASWFHRGDLDRMDHFVDRADTLVICRAHYDGAIGRLVGRAKARGVPVLFDIDDLVFNIDHVHLLIDALDQDLEADATWENWFGWIGRIGATLRLCDRAITTNAFLARQIETFAPGLRASVVPNFLHSEQQAVSRRLFEAKRRSGFARDGNIHIGYFSGTPTHNRDFAVAQGALTRLLDRDPRLVVRVVGFLEPRGELLRHRHRLDIHPLQDFLNLQRLQAEVEVNIVPLQDNVFTNCKSELKYFEAAICGTLTVASPTFVFRRAITNGETGFLAYAHEWEAKLQTAIATLEQPDRYADIAERAFHHAESVYGWNRQATTIEAAVFSSESASGPSAPQLEPETIEEQEWVELRS
jgi:glycosyltransferase involved in cell wall biosynthesis